MAEIAISVDHLSKQYQLGESVARYGRLTESLWRVITQPRRLRSGGSGRRKIWALSDVSLQAPWGEVTGVIGPNRAGKSTLLKILSNITQPTSGSATVYGRVGSLLEVGTGFHPELTGRENIFLSGAILGMSRAEIRRKFDNILEFAEVQEFVDTPLKRYSSGMQVRLGFAVAAHLEPEIMLVDEVLAVGDATFQRRSLAKMEDITREGRTVLFVSHNLKAVESLCTSAVLLERGKVVATGPVASVIDRYLESVKSVSLDSLAERQDRGGDGRLRIVGIEATVRTGTPGSIRFQYSGVSGLRNVEMLVGVYSSHGESVGWLSSEVTDSSLKELPPSGTIVCSFERTSLIPGSYSLNVHCTANGTMADYVKDAAIIDVAEGDFFGTGRLPPPGHGFVLIDHEWTIER